MWILKNMFFFFARIYVQRAGDCTRIVAFWFQSQAKGKAMSATVNVAIDEHEEELFKMTTNKRNKQHRNLQINTGDTTINLVGLTGQQLRELATEIMVVCHKV